MPFIPFAAMNFFALEMNFWRDSEEATILEKYEDGKFQPPMEAITLVPCPTSVLIDAGSFFSTVMSSNSFEEVQEPNGEEAQYGMGELPAGGQKYRKPKYTWSVLAAMGATDAAVCV